MDDQHLPEELERSWIDAQLAAMADDEDYQALQLSIEREFASADWEAWQISEATHATQ